VGAAQDLCYFIGTCFSKEEQQKYGDALIQHYWSELTTSPGGPSADDYPYAMMLEDYKKCMWVSMWITCMGCVIQAHSVPLLRRRCCIVTNIYIILSSKICRRPPSLPLVRWRRTNCADWPTPPAHLHVAVLVRVSGCCVSTRIANLQCIKDEAKRNEGTPAEAAYNGLVETMIPLLFSFLERHYNAVKLCGAETVL
jgi:hypothetical protein